MRKLLVIVAMTAGLVPLLVQSASTQGTTQGSIAAQRRAGPPKGPVPRLPDGTVDLNGVWVGGGPINDIEREGGLKPGTLDALMMPWAVEELKKRDVTMEPHNRCLPMGVPRVTPFPYRFVPNYTHKPATHMFIVHEGNIHSFRQIFMDGRKHPADLESTWYGHSIGRWEKDTLVIDTVGFNDKFWFDRRGTPHTEKLHIVERWTRLDLGRLENKVTIDDPGTFTKPFELTFMATLQPPGDEILEYICQENNHYGIQTLPGFNPITGETKK
jgi:hypothetical protein